MRENANCGEKIFRPVRRGLFGGQALCVSVEEGRVKDELDEGGVKGRPKNG
jgi:hypothetical protein